MDAMPILLEIINLSDLSNCLYIYILAFYWYLLTQRDDLGIIELEACLHENVIFCEVSLSILPDFFQILIPIYREMLIFYLYKMD